MGIALENSRYLLLPAVGGAQCKQVGAIWWWGNQADPAVAVVSLLIPGLCFVLQEQV